jgi:hypothetical protein
MCNIYKLSVVNSSLNETTFTICQDAEQFTKKENVFTLAWCSKRVASGTAMEFQWGKNYNAVWSCPREKLEYGTVCYTYREENETISIPTCQVKDISLTEKNKVTLNLNKKYDLYQFKEPLEEGNGEGIFTHCDNTIPNSQDEDLPKPLIVGVGIGMDGSGTFLFASETNTTFEWTIPEEPKYYLTVGDYKKGQIVDVEEMKKKYLEISYKYTLCRRAEYTENNELKMADL